MVTKKRVCIPFRHESRVGSYVAAVEACGAEAAAVSVEDSHSLERCDGLVLMGGTDVNPQLYGQDPIPEVDVPDDRRDEVEMALLTEALRRDLPILAICRGMQLLNVHLGGTLIQHLASSRHDTDYEDKATVAHEVEVEPSSDLAQLLQTTKLAVNSRHHQAVDRLGKGLVVSARDVEDRDVVEALEQPGHRFLIAVQWHPEDQVQRSLEQRRLFERFVMAL